MLLLMRDGVTVAAAELLALGAAVGGRVCWCAEAQPLITLIYYGC